MHAGQEGHVRVLQTADALAHRVSLNFFYLEKNYNGRLAELVSTNTLLVSRAGLAEHLTARSDAGRVVKDRADEEEKKSEEEKKGRE